MAIALMCPPSVACYVVRKLTNERKAVLIKIVVTKVKTKEREPWLRNTPRNHDELHLDRAQDWVLNNASSPPCSRSRNYLYIQNTYLLSFKLFRKKGGCLLGVEKFG
jgi:hypothetical protein